MNIFDQQIEILENRIGLTIEQLKKKNSRVLSLSLGNHVAVMKGQLILIEDLKSTSIATVKLSVRLKERIDEEIYIHDLIQRG